MTSPRITFSYGFILSMVALSALLAGAMLLDRSKEPLNPSGFEGSIKPAGGLR